MPSTCREIEFTSTETIFLKYIVKSESLFIWFNLKIVCFKSICLHVMMKNMPKINMGWHCFKRMETQFGLQLVFFI